LAKLDNRQVQNQQRSQRAPQRRTGPAPIRPGVSFTKALNIPQQQPVLPVLATSVVPSANNEIMTLLLAIQQQLATLTAENNKIKSRLDEIETDQVQIMSNHIVNLNNNLDEQNEMDTSCVSNTSFPAHDHGQN
jgi:hypothetical protein